MNESLKERVNRLYYETTILIYTVAILDLDLIDHLVEKLEDKYKPKLRFIRHFYWEYKNEYIFSEESETTVNNKKYVLQQKLENIPEYVKTVIENSSVGLIDAIIRHIKSQNITFLENELDLEDIKEYWESARK